MLNDIKEGFSEWWDDTNPTVKANQTPTNIAKILIPIVLTVIVIAVFKLKVWTPKITRYKKSFSSYRSSYRQRRRRKRRR